MIHTNRAIARRKAILDVIVKEQTDADMIKVRKNFISLKEEGKIDSYVGVDKNSTEGSSDIRFILNMYETVAIGIKNNAYDKDIYRNWCRTTAVKDWIACKKFVRYCQRDIHCKIYTEFEELVKEWADDDEKKHI